MPLPGFGRCGRLLPTPGFGLCGCGLLLPLPLPGFGLCGLLLPPPGLGRPCCPPCAGRVFAGCWPFSGTIARVAVKQYNRIPRNTETSAVLIAVSSLSVRTFVQGQILWKWVKVDVSILWTSRGRIMARTAHRSAQHRPILRFCLQRGRKTEGKIPSAPTISRFRLKLRRLRRAANRAGPMLRPHTFSSASTASFFWE